MSRLSSGVLVSLALVACSSKTPGSGEAPRALQQVPLAEPAAASTTPPPDPREAALSGVVVRLLEQEHLLRRKIDDAVSRTAFAAYLDRLDGGKMFLLRSDREALARHADKIDDQLHAGTLDLAHEGSKIFTARVSVVEKMVAELLAQPLDLTNEEYIELDPKKVEPAANEQALRDRWRQRLELEVLERVAQMEDRLTAEAERQAKAKGNAKSPNKAKAATRKPPPAPEPSDGRPASPAAPQDDDDDDDEARAPLASIPTTPEAREAKARADLAKSYAGRFARLRNPGPLDAAADVINAVAASYDPHTTYMPPADKANFDIQITGSLEGIGAVLRERDHYVEIAELVPGGASWRHGGLNPGDVILSVASNGKEPVDTFDMKIDDVVKMIRGPKGTVVRLRIQKQAGHEETVSITRDIVVIEAAYARGAMLSRPGQPMMGYIHLPGFYGGKGTGQRTAAEDVRKLLAEMKTRKAAGVVLDLRSNGGGLLGDAIELTGELIDKGPVVQVEDSRDDREVFGDDHDGTEFDGPVVVLVDRFSASASEIVAGALQDYGRAIVVGTGPTHGKGTVQTIADLDRLTHGKVELGVMKLTIQQFFRISGSSTQREGVVPDILLPDPAGHIDAGERQLEHAIAWSKIAPAPHANWPAPWKTATLVQRSALRVAKHPLLGKISAATQVLRARRNDTRVPLARPAWEARRKQQRAAIEAASPDLVHAPAKLTVTPIEDPATAAVAPSPGGRTDDRGNRWRDSLARDLWVEESVNVLTDMVK